MSEMSDLCYLRKPRLTLPAGLMVLPPPNVRVELSVYVSHIMEQETIRVKAAPTLWNKTWNWLGIFRTAHTTRKHSSRMRTTYFGGRLSCMHTPCHTCHPHHACPLAMHTSPSPRRPPLRQTCPLWTEWQTGVKHYLPITSFASGKN